MAKHPLNDEHLTAHQRVSLGDRALVAIAAHVEVRSVLRSSNELVAHGLADILIGSYARRVSIWPGKDVDVFGRLSHHTIDTLSPDAGYGIFGRALQCFAEEGRLTPQPRSFKVGFGPGRVPQAKNIREAAKDYRWESTRVDRVIKDLDKLAFEFSVDVVPAVHWGDNFGIPEVGSRLGGERFMTGGWRMTNPVALTKRSQDLNKDPRIAGIGALVRVTKVVKQVKCNHLPNSKPSALYYEFILHEGFSLGLITGSTWADITASALDYIATRLTTAGSTPVCDPILRQPYQPVPSPTELVAASATFAEMSSYARRAINSDSRCQAAIEWRKVFGGNQQHQDVFPLPSGCRGTGAALGAAASNIAVGGTAERSFGER
jgi:hypothetical protein